jgi:hypothetical protein
LLQFPILQLVLCNLRMTFHETGAIGGGIWHKAAVRSTYQECLLSGVERTLLQCDELHIRGLPVAP